MKDPKCKVCNAKAKHTVTNELTKEIEYFCEEHHWERLGRLLDTETPPDEFNA